MQHQFQYQLIVSTSYQSYHIFMSDQVVLGYWGIRGRAQPLRHLLCFCNIPFEDKCYLSPDAYGKDMAECGIDFPNLPYLLDGDVKFSETLAIARYIVRKSGRTDLLGNTPEDEAKAHNILVTFNDLFNPALGLFFNKKINDLKMPWFFKSKQQFTKIEKCLEGKDYAIGYLTMVDFFIAEGSFYFEILFPEEYKKFKGIHRIREKIMALPEVQAYYKREPHVLTPFLPPTMTAVPAFWPGTEPQGPPPLTKVSSGSETQSPKKQQMPKQEKSPEVQNIEETKVQQTESAQPPQPPVSEPKYYPPPHQQQAYIPQNGPLKVCVISGSLSGNSSINYLLGKLTSYGHPAFEFEWADISVLELHNQDIDEQGTQNVNNLRGQVYNCNAVLLGMSSTHHGTSIALSNAFNWLTPVLVSRPVSIVSIECQESIENSLRESIKGENIPFLQQTYFGIKSGQEFFNQEGEIRPQNMGLLTGYLNTFAKFVEYVNSTMASN